MKRDGFQKRLAELMVSKGVDAARISEDTEGRIGRTTVLGWENGSAKPGYSTARELARTYNVDLNWLFGVNEEE